MATADVARVVAAGLKWVVPNGTSVEVTRVGLGCGALAAAAATSAMMEVVGLPRSTDQLPSLSHAERFVAVQ